MQERKWPVSFGIGVTFTSPPVSVEEMVKHADELTYEVKRNGKSAIVSQVV
jgi:PleD family two-component response regulator